MLVPPFKLLRLLFLRILRITPLAQLIGPLATRVLERTIRPVGTAPFLSGWSGHLLAIIAHIALRFRTFLITTSPDFPRITRSPAHLLPTRAGIFLRSQPAPLPIPWRKGPLIRLLSPNRPILKTIPAIIHAACTLPSSAWIALIAPSVVANGSALSLLGFEFLPRQGGPIHGL